uniref:Disease resistance R13L4/SHOC-2-like LRR domain-containing protein n=1 Tax=Fagus sylvatica TaxID=28930 RepID=A0A2N9FM44_FAGSY
MRTQVMSLALTSVVAVSMVQSTLTAVSSVLFTYKALTLLTITLTTLKSHPRIGNLSRLTYLNLSSSMFSGQIPFEVSKLSQLSSLYLCCNIDLSSWNIKLLQLKELSLTSLVENLTRLENLDLGGVTIVSTVPNIFANLSTLRSLYLHDCGMYGEFPRGIFKLPNLRVLDMKYNKNLTGSLPDFQNWRSPLKEMTFADTSFSGELPASMGNLGSLIAFDMWGCNLSGSIPYSIGNLTNLVYLQLSNNSLAGNIPSSIGNLIQLAFLGLYDNQLSGPIPFGLANLTQLTVLSLESNRLTGPIPFGLMNLTQLHILVLEANELQGQFPISSFNLKNLNILAISDNYLQWYCVQFATRLLFICLMCLITTLVVHFLNACIISSMEAN